MAHKSQNLLASKGNLKPVVSFAPSATNRYPDPAPFIMKASEQLSLIAIIGTAILNVLPQLMRHFEECPSDEDRKKVDAYKKISTYIDYLVQANLPDELASDLLMKKILELKKHVPESMLVKFMKEYRRRKNAADKGNGGGGGGGGTSGKTDDEWFEDLVAG